MKSRVICNLNRKRILINIPNSGKRLKINILLPPIETLCNLNTLNTNYKNELKYIQFQFKKKEHFQKTLAKFT